MSAFPEHFMELPFKLLDRIHKGFVCYLPARNITRMTNGETVSRAQGRGRRMPLKLQEASLDLRQCRTGLKGARVMSGFRSLNCWRKLGSGPETSHCQPSPNGEIWGTDTFASTSSTLPSLPGPLSNNHRPEVKGLCLVLSIKICCLWARSKVDPEVKRMST